MTGLATVRTWGRMVQFPHTLFALPFALSGAALATAGHGISPAQLFWIVVAMVGARNAALGFNRLVDQRFDAENPRTADRDLPRGRLSRRAVWAFTAVLASMFVLAAFRLNPLCGWLSPLALAVVLGYSYTKRFTWASHLVLGLALAAAPLGGWAAVRGSLSPVAWLLGAAVLMWVAGFDVIYACQDVEFDRRQRLFSVPARFGVARALVLARVLHCAALVTLAGVGALAELHPVYWIGWLAIAVLLAWEHRLVRVDDLSRLDVAFFKMNGIISVVYLVTVLASVLLDGAGVLD